MEILGVLRDVRDPAVFLFCVAMVFYLNKNYVSKEQFNAFKNDFDKMQDDYVSKEKLSDVLKPVEDHLKSIGRELGEIKKFIVDRLTK